MPAAPCKVTRWTRYRRIHPDIFLGESDQIEEKEHNDNQLNARKDIRGGSRNLIHSLRWQPRFEERSAVCEGAFFPLFILKWHARRERDIIQTLFSIHFLSVWSKPKEDGDFS